MDILDYTYNILMDNHEFQTLSKGNVKYFEYPQTSESDYPKVVITPLDAPLPSDFADDKWLTYDCLLQIDVYAKSRSLCNELSNCIRNTLWNKGFKQQSGPLDYAKGTFRDARRYRNVVYREDIEEI